MRVGCEGVAGGAELDYLGRKLLGVVPIYRWNYFGPVSLDTLYLVLDTSCQCPSSLSREIEKKKKRNTSPKLVSYVPHPNVDNNLFLIFLKRIFILFRQALNILRTPFNDTTSRYITE